MTIDNHRVNKSLKIRKNKNVRREKEIDKQLDYSFFLDALNNFQ